MNGDGFDDILLGSRQHDAGQINEGKAFLHLGTPSGATSAPIWTAESDQAGAQFGFVPKSAGDVNSDGYADVLILADLYDNPEASEGAAFLWLGGPSGKILQGINGTPLNADWSVEGNQPGTFLRWGGGAGDFDADGFGDVVVGASLYDAGQSDEGRILIFRGSPAGLEVEPAWVAEGNISGARLGWTADGAGDVNGDGAGDVLAGAEGMNAARVFHGFPAVSCVDRDGDGYGLPGSPSCPGGSAPDCNDSEPAVFPGAPEHCDGVDEDCDGTIDEGNPEGGADCDTGLAGACASGRTECRAGSLACVAPSPLPEVCDGADNDCDRLVDEGVRIQATGSSTPSTLNVNSQGTSFSVRLTLNDVCDPGQVQALDGDLLERVYLSRAGSQLLPDPLSIACPAADGETLFERGIADNPLSRNASGNQVTLRFDLASDGDCSTLDGDRQEVIALFSDVPLDSVVLLCLAGRADGADFESCMPVTVKNHGNR